MEAAITYTGFTAVALLAIQGLRTSTTSGLSHKPYLSEDDTASTDSEPEPGRIRFLSLFINAAAAIGISICILDASYSTSTTTPWSLPSAAAGAQIGTWVLISAQVVSIANTTAARQRFRNGVYCAASAAVLTLSSVYQSTLHAKHPQSHFLSAFCALAIGSVSLSFPRQPVLSQANWRVDQQSSASIVSLLTFSWYPLYEQRFSNIDRISLDELPTLPATHRIERMRRIFASNASQDSLLRRLVWTWRKTFVLQWTIIIIYSTSQFLGHYMLLKLLRHLEASPSVPAQGYLCVAGMGVALISEHISAGWITWITQARLSLPMTALLKGLMFESMSSRYKLHDDKSDTPQVDALMSHECTSVSNICDTSQHVPKVLFKLLLDVSYLIHLIGFKHIAIGSLFPIILFPISKMLAHRHRLAKLRLANLHNEFSADVSELLRNLRQIRLSSMEDLWKRRIIASRARELGQIWQCGTIISLLSLVTNLAPILLVSVSLSSYALEVGHLSPSLAFTSIGLFRTLHTTVQELPTIFTNFQESLAASQRIQKYLDQNEKRKAPKKAAISFRKAMVSWPADQTLPGSVNSTFQLRNISLTFPIGKLSVITGKTSSGKGLLLSAILGESNVISGTLKMLPSLLSEKRAKFDSTAIAFVSQPPWIEDCTIMQNILFGAALDQERYLAVLHACALEKDIAALPDGDKTMAGVNGGALSGGQKWRVGLARALYSDARVIILDDVLSAVDPHVARWLCHHALSGDLVRGRTTIIATHHNALCEHLASYIVTVANGTASGRLNTATGKLDEPLLVEPVPRSTSNSPRPSHLAELKGVAGSKMHSRRSTAQVFSTYVFGGGVWPVMLACLATFICRMLAAGNSWWLTKWTSSHDIGCQTLRSNLYMYLALSVGSAVALALHAVAVQHVSLRASRVLFQKAVQAVLRTPLRWIDTAPLGKLLQTLTSDMYLIDHRVATGLSDLLRIAMQLLLIISTSGIATTDSIIPLGFVLGIYLKITMRHLQLSRRLNRLAPLALEPILAHTSSTESGILTIRAFRKTGDYVSRMYKLLDIDVRLNWHIILGQRWIHVRYGIIGSLYVLATAVALVYAGADPATAGFTLNIALQIKATMSGMMGKTNMLNGGARAIDRVLEVVEATTETENGTDTEATWPQNGAIDVKSLAVRYDKSLPAVVKDITFSLSARQRLGVVGRTGAGKTSLVNALLRFVDIEHGQIRIDGVDIASIKLSHLRRSITLIPQDPFLLSDTLRANLCIYGGKTDEEMRCALKKVTIVSKDGKRSEDALHSLDMIIQPEGANLSHGQRQMICLARAVLNPRRIIILDEATSSVDRPTDAMIQRTLRHEFAESTIIVVAHRLATVVDFDRVLVLDDGVAAEFGSPAELVNKQGIFWDMVNQSGDAENIKAAVEKRCQTDA